MQAWANNMQYQYANQHQQHQQPHAAGVAYPQQAAAAAYYGQPFQQAAYQQPYQQQFYQQPQAANQWQQQAAPLRTAGAQQFDAYYDEPRSNQKKKGVVPDALRPWMQHVKAVKSRHAGMAYKDVLILAKRTYRKKH